MDHIRIALWQGPSPAGNFTAAEDALTRAVKAAAAMGADVLVAPELFLPGYNQDSLPDLAQPRGGEWHQWLCDLAQSNDCALVVGYAEREGDDLYNSAVAIGAEGRELAHYRKIQLYGPREQGLFQPGGGYATFDLAGVKAALLICYDVEFAPHVAALAGQGVRLILCPTANMAPFTHVARVTVPAMAVNHGVSIVYANYSGTEGYLTYVGQSLIADPYGEVVAQAGTGPALLVADLPLTWDDTRLSTQARDLRIL